MDVNSLEDAGLTKIQAAMYKKLIELGGTTAPHIANIVGESRTNAYKVLDKLCDMGLATKDLSKTKVHYYPASPAVLEQLMQVQSEQVAARTRKLEAALPGMLDFFFQHSEQPSIRYFQGKEGVQNVFRDMLKTGKDVYLLRSPGDVAFYDEAFFADFRKKRAKLGIKTYALTPDVPSAIHDSAIDLNNKFVRTWLAPDAYTANVEWDIYGNKIALISYGEEAIATIIESRQIADSFRQVFELLQRAYLPRP